MNDGQEDEGMNQDGATGDNDTNDDPVIDSKNRVTTPSPRRRCSDKRKIDDPLAGSKPKVRDSKSTPDRPQPSTSNAQQPSSSHNTPTKRQGDDAELHNHVTTRDREEDMA